MASLRERLIARQEEKLQQARVAPAVSLRDRLVARQAQRAQENPRGFVSPETAGAQVEAAQGGPPLFQMSTSGEAFKDGQPASTLDLLKGAFTGDFQLPPEQEQEPAIGRQPGPLEPTDPLSQKFLGANRGFGEQNTITGAPSRLIDFLANTPEGNRLALEVTAGIAAASVTGGASLAPKALSALGKLKSPLPGLVLSPMARQLGPNATRAVAAGTAEGMASLGASATFAPIEDPISTASGTAVAAGLGEGVGGKVGEKIVERIAKLKSGSFGSVEGAERAIAQLDKHGVVIPAGNVSTSRLIDIPQKATESAILGGKKLQVAAEAAEKAALSDLRKVVNNFASEGGAETTGKIAQKAQEVAFAAGTVANTARYAKVDELAGGVGVDFTDVLKRVDEIAADADVTPGLREKAKTLGKSILKVVQPEQVVGTGQFENVGSGLLDVGTAKEITRTIPANNIVSWKQAAAFRTVALKVGRDPAEFIAGDAQRAGKRLSPIIGEVMDKAIAKLGKEASAVAKDATNKYRQFADIYTDTGIELLAKADADKFIRHALKPRSPVSIRRARMSIKDPVVWEKIQGQWMLDLMEKATVAASSGAGDVALPQAKIITNSIRKFGRGALDELFPNPRDLRKFEEFVRTLEITQQGAGKGLPGGIFIQMQQSDAILIATMGSFGAASGKAMAGAAGILLGPLLAGRMLTNPKFVKWAVIGMKANPGSTAAIRAFSQMTVMYNREKNIQEKRLKKQREQQSATSQTAIP